MFSNFFKKYIQLKKTVKFKNFSSPRTNPLVVCSVATISWQRSSKNQNGAKKLFILPRKNINISQRVKNLDDFERTIYDIPFWNFMIEESIPQPRS